MTDVESCPFCTIVQTYPHPASAVDEDEPTYVVLSTDHTLAFLDRLPLTKCHTLVIPRVHYEKLSDIPSEIAAELGRVLPILSRAIMEVSGADGFNVVQNNGSFISFLGAG
jgi:diadenosine tetraphosphate (Ap4A) HIT family hydrolase